MGVRKNGAFHAIGVRFQHEERPGRLAARERVDQDQQVVAFEKLIRQVHAPDAEVGDLDPLRELRVGESPRDLDAEPVVPEEDIPDAGHEAPLHGAFSSGSTSSGEK